MVKHTVPSWGQSITQFVLKKPTIFLPSIPISWDQSVPPLYTPFFPLVPWQFVKWHLASPLPPPPPACPKQHLTSISWQTDKGIDTGLLGRVTVLDFGSCPSKMLVSLTDGCDWVLRTAVPSRTTCHVAFEHRAGPETVISLWAGGRMRLISLWRMTAVGCWRSWAADQTCPGREFDPWRSPCRSVCRVCTGPVHWSDFSPALAGFFLMPSVLPPETVKRSIISQGHPVYETPKSLV